MRQDEEHDMDDFEDDVQPYKERFTSTFARYEWHLHILTLSSGGNTISPKQVFELLDEAVFHKVAVVSDFTGLAFLPAAGSVLWGAINEVLYHYYKVRVYAVIHSMPVNRPEAVFGSARLNAAVEVMRPFYREIRGELDWCRMMGPLMLDMYSHGVPDWIEEMKNGLAAACEACEVPKP
ncbi:MAG: hypothetical protein EA392_09790 [Cryomorphaceae bacterium]|nr:MAG: hypothetical protein EA392_09790 [Cryomorphaceae bacterium]